MMKQTVFTSLTLSSKKHIFSGVMYSIHGKTLKGQKHAATGCHLFCGGAHENFRKPQGGELGMPEQEWAERGLQGQV